MEACKSGLGPLDVQELAALDGHGQNSNRIAGQILANFCQRGDVGLRQPYIFEATARLRTGDAACIFQRKIGVLAWPLDVSDQEGFWDRGSLDDLQFKDNPVKDAGVARPMIPAQCQEKEDINNGWLPAQAGPRVWMLQREHFFRPAWCFLLLEVASCSPMTFLD